ncbi:hypothetical protein [Psychrobacillus sp. NPDC096389]|uniref:hypothetical protein n=1 Tax=Psychrobacillus sp. NPDC096389 TaxID=3364490 RepID=UPI00380DA3AC
MMKSIWKLVVGLILTLLSIPMILSGLMTINFFGKALGSADGWLSYWGGYLGAMLGLAAVTIATQFQINSQTKLHKEQLDMQMKAIDVTAELNDSKERNRIRMTYLLNKNEEILELLIDIQSLLVTYLNSITRYAEYHEKAFMTFSTYHNLSESNKTKDDKRLEELETQYSQQVKFKNQLLDENTILRIKIVEKLSILSAKGVHFKKFHLLDEKKYIESSLSEFYDEIESTREYRVLDKEFYKSAMIDLNKNVEQKGSLLLSRIDNIIVACESEAERLLEGIISGETE